MSSMFDKLGDMLNECLEKGEIPQPPPKRSYHREDDSRQDGTMEQEPITLPRDVEAALEFLGLAGAKTEGHTHLSLPTLAQVRAAYAQLLKEAHPDTAQENITSAESAQRISQLTQAFNKVREWFREELGIRN